ncbi:podocalyxin-like protein 2 [Pangasianodon hypophthalmus]|uniref:podocalyxin-like protein 2 n=1 Tax=Pangasianodon hypophthalmus TaxID=310915 RepID=UPI000F00AC4A|nr:podocalyxin-like protein 2 [Pangasianodon hypophthalmus]XP_053082944.1 podocalyxin-like protein 2 [Pangasianodon hypophthalmus]
MPGTPLHHLIIGSSLVLIAISKVLNGNPTPLSSSASSQPILDVSVGLEEHDGVLRDAENPAMPALVESSQESSGFFSEDSEENKGPLALRKWDVQAELNSSLDADSLIGYNPSSTRPSSLTLRQAPKKSNSSSPFFLPVVKASDPEQWHREIEASGFPVHSSSPLSTTAAAPLIHSSVTDTHSSITESMAGFFGPNSPLPEATAGADSPEEDFDDVRENILTQAPTIPEIGVFSSQVPFEPDDSHQDDSEEQEENEEIVVFPTEVDGQEVDVWKPPSSADSDTPVVAFTETAWHEAGGEEEEESEESELRHGGTDYLSETDLHGSQEAVQVICVDWSDLAGKGYVILNMSEDYDCDKFRVENGDRLLEMLESTFSRKMNSPQGSWLISLSKPTKQEHQLLMTLANEQGVIPTKDVLSMLGEVRRGLNEIGIQNFSSVSTCHSRPSQTRSDYGKLFVVLVIIGSVCVIIIASGLIYICWQRRLPKMKSMSRGEELHFVENGCHDNPTLDVTSDGQPEPQEKQHSTNGVPAGTGAWQGMPNKSGKEEEDDQEEDTHL